MLQGTLDVFSLDEVLGLLSSAEKSGVLSVSGDRGVGSVSLRSGDLVGGEIEAVESDTATAVFELLRFENGSFSFDVAADVSGGTPAALDDVLQKANTMLAEWRTIEAVVPSMHHVVKLNSSIATSKSVSPGDWEAIVATGDGATVGAISGRLGLGEFDGSARIKSLVENDFVALMDPAFAPGSELPSRAKPAPAPPIPEPIAPVADLVDAHDVAAADAAGLIDDEADVPSRRAEDEASNDAVAMNAVSANAVSSDDHSTDDHSTDDHSTDDHSTDDSTFEAAPLDDASFDAASLEVVASSAASSEDGAPESSTDVETATFESVMPDEADMEAFEASVPPAPAPAAEAAPGESDGSLLMRYLKSNG